MGTSKSAEKRARQNIKRRLRNRSVKRTVNTFVSQAVASIRQAEPDDASTATVRAQRALDKASQKGIIHHRNAARRKSRLMKKLSAAQTASA